jgi:hypothetical protein
MSNAIQVEGTTRVDVGEQAETGPQVDRQVRQQDSPQEEVVTKPRRISYNCPVCGGFVRTLFDAVLFFECEDDDGVVSYYHDRCYSQALEADE